VRWRTRSGTRSPGPAYVKSFLRTYATPSGLDAKRIVEEYKVRHERPATPTCTRSGRRARATGAGANARRPALGPHRRRPGRDLGALYALGQGAEDDGDRADACDEPTTTEAREDARERRPRRLGRRSAAARGGAPGAAADREPADRPTGAVSVCLVDAAGRVRVRNESSSPGRRAGCSARARSAWSSATTGALRVNGRDAASRRRATASRGA
jgi:hypothetical protein